MNDLKDLFLEIKRRWLHSYRTTREVLEIGMNLDEDNLNYNILFNHKMAVKKSMALDRINNPLEQMAMDFAWITYRIKHPIKMYRFVKQNNKP